MAGIAYAQNMWQGNDSSGNSTTIYENSPGIYQWGNSQGQTGTMQQMMPAPSMARNLC